MPKIKRKNPGYGIPMLAAAVGIPTWAFVTSLVAGTTVGLGVGGAYAYKKWGEGGRFHKDVISQSALNLLQQMEEGYRADNPNANRAFLDIPGIATSAVRPPPTESAAYAQGGLYLAIAAAMDKGNPVLVDKAGEFLSKVGSASQDATGEVSGEVKRAPLKEAVAILTATGNSRFAPVVQRLLSLARPGGVEDTMQDVKTYSVSTMAVDTVKESVADVSAPARLVAGLWSGKNPFQMEPWKWNMLRFSIYGVGGFLLYRIIANPFIEASTQATDIIKETGEDFKKRRKKDDKEE
jgi:hypothetical protein